MLYQLPRPGDQRVAGDKHDVVLAPPVQQQPEEQGAGDDALQNPVQMQRPDPPGGQQQQQDGVVDFWAPKTYGPKAELRRGVLGNYEPVIKPSGGPGELCLEMENLFSTIIQFRLTEFKYNSK